MSLLLEQQQIFDSYAYPQGQRSFDEYATDMTNGVSRGVAKMGQLICDGTRDDVASEVIPRLSIYRGRLINVHQLPATVCGEIDRLPPHQEGALREMVRAGGELAYYLDDEYGERRSVRHRRVVAAVRHLNVAAEALGRFHGVNVEEAHLAYLQQQLGEEDMCILDIEPETV